MKGWIVLGNGVIEEHELRFVDDDTVRTGTGGTYKKGEWALILDTAKHLAEQAIERCLKSLVAIGDPMGYVPEYRKQLREMRGDGKYQIKRLSSR